MSVFTGDMILYMENPKDFTKKLLDLISELGKVEGYKINIWELMAFLYISNELVISNEKDKLQNNLNYYCNNNNNK